MSSVVDLSDEMHVVYGTIIYASSAPVLTCNDESATVTDTGTGNATINFGQAFRSAPHIGLGRIKMSNTTTNVHLLEVDALTTTSMSVQNLAVNTSAAGTTDLTGPDPSDGDGYSFIAVGERAN